MASPHVAGVAALVWSNNPLLTNVQLEDKLKKSAVDLGQSGFDTTYGYGLINAIKTIGS